MGNAAETFFPVRSFVRSLVAIIFHRRENFFGRAKILEKKVWVAAIDSVKKSSKSELSSRFLGRLKILNVTMRQVKCRFGGAVNF